MKERGNWGKHAKTTKIEEDTGGEEV